MTKSKPPFGSVRSRTYLAISIFSLIVMFAIQSLFIAVFGLTRWHTWMISILPVIAIVGVRNNYRQWKARPNASYGYDQQTKEFRWFDMDESEREGKP